jgi:aminopeptidase-like protein
VRPGEQPETAAARGQSATRRDSSLRAVLETLDAERAGGELHALVRELFPIDRSITGQGLRESLRVLQRVIPLQTVEVPSATPVFDWVVPREWNVREAWVKGPGGEDVADFRRSNLHLVGYSVPFRGRLSLDQLQEHLHSLPEQPTLVPYRTSYYKEAWGFCIAHEARARLRPGEYEVLVDTTLEDGSLTYGELMLPGATADEVLVSAHCCHASLGNDNLSGMVVATWLARTLSRVATRFTYRFLFAPVTIGAITWLARNEEQVSRVRHGLVLAGVGDSGRHTYKRSRRGNADVDRAAAHVLDRAGEPFELRDFSPYGYDERQFCSPGFDLPVGALSRTPFGEYPEYHTSADDLAFVKPEALAGTYRRCLELLEVLEGNETCLNLNPKCEPQLGKRGLYGSVGGGSHAFADQMALLWVLSLSDGGHDLLEIAERASLPFHKIRAAADALQGAGLLGHPERSTR